MSGRGGGDGSDGGPPGPFSSPGYPIITEKPAICCVVPYVLSNILLVRVIGLKWFVSMKLRVTLV